ncbi:MAG TPA: DUF3562 domain-containing protein [Steroidobacteraceae bacterium]|nr:DUF3562 domain-containing protein [Steroidobacteraceae bacterium]
MDISAPFDTTADIQLLARETDSPLDLVEKIYVSERAKLEKGARIKTYVRVLTHRYVKERLRERRAAA